MWKLRDRSSSSDLAARGVSSSGAGLRAAGVSVHFAGIKAVDGVDLELRDDEILGLIGPNGAGKTTLVNALSGFQSLTAGRVRLGERDVTGMSAQRLSRIGLTRTFQGVRAFPTLTVADNVELGGVGGGFSRRVARRNALTILDALHLGDLADVEASALPHGAQRRLGIARAIATRPRFLLLDEPGAGLNEGETDALIEMIGFIRHEYACGVLVIEHDMRLIMSVCERIQVLDHGQTICIGTPDEVQRDPAVLTAYLGTKRGRHVAGA